MTIGSMRLSRLLPPLFALAALAAPAAERYPVPATPQDLAAPAKDAVTTPTGLATLIMRHGRSEPHPAGDDLVTVEYTIWTPDGNVLDTTARKPGPWIRPLSLFMPGMKEGLKLMTPGEKLRMWMPRSLAFPQAPDSLILEAELVAIAPSPFLAPPDVAGPGDGASLLPSGLAFKVLRAGTGTATPARNDRVAVHYTGWTTDGAMFDSSWSKGRPVSFDLDEVIKGWTQGLQLMKVGQKNRFWVPQKLAYQGQEGKPAGMLVFDVELLAIGK